MIICWKHLDNTGAGVDKGLLVVVVEGGLVGISSNDVNMLVHDCLVENIKGIMGPTHFGRGLYVSNVEDCHTDLCQA